MADLTVRSADPEWMDTREVATPTLRDTFRFLSLTNRFFGGNRVILKTIGAWSKKWRDGEPIRILDVGTGGGDIPLALAAWAERKGAHLLITGIERLPAAVEIARKNTRRYDTIHIRQDDFWSLDETTDSFDYVVSSLFLHHVPIDQNVRALRHMDRIAKRGLIVSDLLRSRSSYNAVALLSYVAGNSIVKNDGPLSVRRAFTMMELADLIEAAGLSYLTARREPWFRVSLSGEKRNERLASAGRERSRSRA